MIKNLKTILNLKNPWWQSKTAIPDIPKTERGIVEDLQKISTNEAMVLIGPRQSGKTTAMLQTIKHLLESIDPFNITYAPMDLLKDASINDIIKTHQELTGKTKKNYYFFDEVHFDKNWSVNLKTLIDNKDKNYYYATGSSSTLLLKDSTESGLGRFIFKSIFPLSFKEYSTFLGNKPKLNFTFDETIYKTIKNEMLLISEQQKLEPIFQKYLLWGGFPLQLSQRYDIHSWHNTLRQNYVSLTIYKDILSRYEIRDPSILEDMIYLVAEKTTLPLSYDSIAKSFHLTLETARTYLNYLEAAGLLITCEYFTKNVLKKARRNKKFYLIDPGFNTALNYETTLSDSLASKNVETAVSICLIRHLKKQTGLLNPRLFYWKDAYEVDFVIERAGKIVAIEVKYKNELQDKDLQGILKFLDLFNLKKGIVVTKNTIEMRQINDKTLFLIPAPLFLSAIE
jgi:hypothetical protein